jgi:hypothetical protein
VVCCASQVPLQPPRRKALRSYYIDDIEKRHPRAAQLCSTPILYGCCGKALHRQQYVRISLRCSWGHRLTAATILPGLPRLARRGLPGLPLARALRPLRVRRRPASGRWLAPAAGPGARGRAVGGRGDPPGLG